MMILARINYKTSNITLLAIIKVFKTWYYYLKITDIRFLILLIIITFANL